jgi:hypothetical protein
MSRIRVLRNDRVRRRARDPSGSEKVPKLAHGKRSAVERLGFEETSGIGCSCETRSKGYLSPSVETHRFMEE